MSSHYWGPSFPTFLCKHTYRHVTHNVVLFQICTNFTSYLEQWSVSPTFIDIFSGSLIQNETAWLIDQGTESRFQWTDSKFFIKSPPFGQSRVIWCICWFLHLLLLLLFFCNSLMLRNWSVKLKLWFEVDRSGKN